MLNHFVIAIACFLILSPSVHASDDKDAIWRQAQELVLAGSYRQALPLVAELARASTVSPDVLEALALTHLKLGQRDDAAAALEALVVAVPDDDEAVLMLGQLYYVDRRENKLIALMEQYPDLPWDDEFYSFLYSLSATTPATPAAAPTTAGATRMAMVIDTGSNLYGTRYEAFLDESAHDEELSREHFIKIKMPLTNDWFVTPQLTWQDEHSERNPTSIQRYAVETTSLDLAVSGTMATAYEAKVQFGSLVTDTATPATFDDVPFGSIWQYGGTLSRRVNGASSRVGVSRNYFSDPDGTELSLHRVRRWFGTHRQAVNEQMTLAAYVSYFDYNGDNESFTKAEGWWEWTPVDFRRLTWTTGAHHKFKDRDETTVFTGGDVVVWEWDRGALFINLGGEVNVETDELSAIAGFFCRWGGQPISVDIGGQVEQELKVDDRSDLFLYVNLRCEL